MAEAPALDIITTVVHPNEVCEGMRQGPMNGRWIERVFVVRGDTIARYETDYGPVENFAKIFEQMIPGDGETTVAEFMAEGARHRTDTRWWDHLQRLRAESTLMSDVREQLQAKRLYIRNRTVMGPYFSIQRNMYPREHVWRKYFDKRSERTGKRVLTA